MNPAQKKPIGFYLKKADQLLTENIDRIHSEFEITRTDWQILNSIFNSSEIGKQKLLQTLNPFADLQSLDNQLTTLKEKKLIAGHENYSLTEQGLSLYKTCLEKQNLFRKQAMKGISEQEYIQTISTLEQLIENISTK